MSEERKLNIIIQFVIYLLEDNPLLHFSFSSFSSSKRNISLFFKHCGTMQLCVTCCIAELRTITQCIVHEYADKWTRLITRNSKKMAIEGVWLQVESQQYDPLASKLVWELAIKPVFGIPVDPAAVEENKAKLDTVLDVYGKRLSQSKYFRGDCFTVADLHHLPTIKYLNTKV